MPRVSVIVPCYNQARYVAECLDSVLDQTFKDYEIIIVNDGSTDNSEAVIRSYVKKYKNIKLINQPNQGVVAARNNAIAKAGGKYIYPLDADDTIAPQCLEHLHNVICATEYRVVASEAWTFGKRSGFYRQPRFNKYEMYGKHAKCVISAMFYKEDFIKFGGYRSDFNGFGGDDMDYWLNYVDNDYPMIRLPEVLFFYRAKARDESVWANYSQPEMKKRAKQTEAMLLKYHPKMYWWAVLYKATHSKFAKLFYRDSIKHNRRQIKILGVTVYRGKIIS